MIPLYRADPYLRSCETVIDRVLTTPDHQVIFCREALFVEGGGQPMDYGSLTVEGQTYPLLKIIKEKGNTGYAINLAATVSKGQPVRCDLDWERRHRIMRIHSAQHALAGALRTVRPTILTGGMQIAGDAATCTLVYPEASALGEGDLAQAQSVLAAAISANRSIRSESVESEAEAVQKFGVLYRPTIASGSLKGKIRLIVIDGLDANACGGTHVRGLSEVGSLSIVALTDNNGGKLVTISVD